MPRKRVSPAVRGKVRVGTDSIGRPIWRRIDDPKAKLLARTVAGPNACLIWTGAKTDQGYGHITVNGERCYTHRLSYELHVGPIPDGMHLDHLCRVRACCNPHHLEPVSPGENTRRGEPANRTHCPAGHAYDKANTRIRKRLDKKSGAPITTRECRACGAERNRRKSSERTTCNAGHELEPENTIVRRDGVRLCRICREAGAARHSGELNTQTRLSRAQVEEIRARVAAGESHSRVAAHYGVSRQTVGRIAARQVWR